MAKVSGTRPSSRQNQESTAVAGRTMRSTRSQSRETSEQPVTPKRRGGRKAKTTVDLDTVDEDAAVEDQPQDEFQVLDDAEDVRRISAHSGMSGTTAKTSFSQEEISERDPDLMIDALPRLAAAADELAKLLVPADPKLRPVVRKEIRTVGSKQNKLYNARIGPLNFTKETFGSKEYIQPTVVLRALLGVTHMRDVPLGSWRPDRLINKINLALMLRTVLVVSNTFDATEEGYNALVRLQADFPQAVTGPGFTSNSFQLSLALLTQYAIMQVRVFMADPNFDAHQIITDAFYSMNEEGGKTFSHHVDLHMTELSLHESSDLSNAVEQRVDELMMAFEGTSVMAALGTLRAQFPWEAFVEHVIQYYLERKLEIEGEIDAVGGTDQIMLDLTAEVERRASGREADLKRQSLQRPGTTPNKGFGRTGIHKMMKMQAGLTASTAPAPVTAPVAPTNTAPARGNAPVAQMTDVSIAEADQHAATRHEDDWQRIEDDDYPILPNHSDVSSITTAQGTALLALEGVRNTQRQNAAKGKARFIDPQPNAKRITFDDDSQEQTQHQSPRRTPAKRAFEQAQDDEDEAEFEPTQDRGFEVDTRDTTAADERRKAALQHRAPLPRFSNTADSSAPRSSAVRASATPSPSKRQRKNPGSSIPAPLPPLDPEDDAGLSADHMYQRAKVAARHNTVAATQRKPQQTRTPWSVREEDALIRYIEQEGHDTIPYAMIKNIDSTSGDPVFLRRSAEDLRFKARNMKEVLLKGRFPLPPNFHQINLDRKAIEKLRSLGIEYRQERVRGALVEVDSQ